MKKLKVRIMRARKLQWIKSFYQEGYFAGGLGCCGRMNLMECLVS